MRPTLNLDFRYGARDVHIALQSPMQGFDSLRIVSQIISLQCLHYLVLSLVLPFLLAASPLDATALNFQGGPTSLSMILDWREIAGIPIQNGGRPWPWKKEKPIKQAEKDSLLRSKLNSSNMEDMDGLNKWWEWDVYLQSDSLHWFMSPYEEVAWEGQRPGRGGVHDTMDLSPQAQLQGDSQIPTWWPIFARDSRRGWIIILAWALTGVADVFLLSMLIRRPTHILDHTLTLHLFHFILTSLYTRIIPTSLFYWLAMLAHAGACVVWAEALSIRREMRTGWTSGWEDSETVEQGDHGGEEEEERSRLLAGNQAPSMSQSSNRPTTHVLFEDEDEDDDDNVGPKRGKKEPNGDGHHHHIQEDIEMKRLD